MQVPLQFITCSALYHFLYKKLFEQSIKLLLSFTFFLFPMYTILVPISFLTYENFTFHNVECSNVNVSIIQSDVNTAAAILGMSQLDVSLHDKLISPHFPAKMDSAEEDEQREKMLKDYAH